MIKINPREIAAEALTEIVKEQAYNNIILKKILKRNGAMPVQDRAFVTEIVNGTLRNLYYIDFMLNKLSSVKTEKMKPWILSVLRISVYQIEFMDKVPNSAVCNEAVNLIKSKNFGKLSGFANAVLRAVIRSKEKIEFPNEEKEPIQYLSVFYSYPEWLLKMWLHEYSYEFVKSLCQKNNTSPDVTIVNNSLKIVKENLKKELELSNIIVKEGFYCDEAFHLSKTANLSSLEQFQKGYFHIQDESSMLDVYILDPKPNEFILDMCAAPGGKSFFMAERMENKGSIVSRDIFEHKLAMIEETAQRLGITMIETQQKDASQFYEEDVEQFDKVLVDAPCSGLGLIRKKPDIKLKKNGNDIDSLCQLQKEILNQAAYYVKKGGILVYSTCTICKKENNKNIEWFLDTHKNFQLENAFDFLPNNLKDNKEEKMVQLFPHIHNVDGFFIARMKREG